MLPQKQPLLQVEQALSPSCLSLVSTDLLVDPTEGKGEDSKLYISEGIGEEPHQIT